MGFGSSGLSDATVPDSGGGASGRGCGAGGPALSSASVMTEFVIHTTADGPLFITGDGAALGGWRADAVRLDRWADGSHRVRLDLPADRPARWLVTRGHWRVAETTADGSERQPRETAPGSPLAEAHVEGWGRESVRYHHDVRSIQLPHPRPVSVWLPPGYDLDPARRYPVLYMHDGQNLFDPHTAFGGVPWGVDETAERLIRGGVAAPVMIVGVGNTQDRLKEYGPHDRRPGEWDLARAYGRFLTGELKPLIDATYRTLPGPADTGVGGSSMGGLISLFLCRWYPEVFGRCLAMSPSLWWDQELALRTFAGNTAWLRTARVWLDIGGREGATPAAQRANVRRARRLARLFRHHGFADFRFTEDRDAGHDERAWGWRFAEALPYLFPPE